MEHLCSKNNILGILRKTPYVICNKNGASGKKLNDLRKDALKNTQLWTKKDPVIERKKIYIPVPVLCLL